MTAFDQRAAEWGGPGGAGISNEGIGRGRPLHRRSVTDYGSSATKWMLGRKMRWRRTARTFEHLRPSAAYTIDMLLPSSYPDNPSSSIPTKHIHASLNKIKHPVNVVKWTPEGRRLLTGSSSGEFTLWNGMGFNFETIMQAHDSAIRACEYSHADDWLLSGDHDGVVKYWQPNFNNVKIIEAHREPIRDLSFSPTDAKFVTASDDNTLKVWNFNEGEEERTLAGHGWDVKCVDWHPTKGLIASGSKDHVVKLWDPRVARCLTTLHGHKNTISKALFQPTRGELLATCARDQVCRIFELRAMKDLCVLRGHEKDISTLAWHPIHPSLLSTGGADGSINHYLLDELSYNSANAQSNAVHPAASVPFAHEYAIWSMEYHPLGHILCTGSNDRITRFWGRPRPGEVDSFKDRYHVADSGTEGGFSRDKFRKRHYGNEEEEEDAENDADALVDQTMPVPSQQSGTSPDDPNVLMLDAGRRISDALPPGLGDLSAFLGNLGAGGGGAPPLNMLQPNPSGDMLPPGLFPPTLPHDLPAGQLPLPFPPPVPSMMGGVERRGGGGLGTGTGGVGGSGGGGGAAGSGAGGGAIPGLGKWGGGSK